MVSAALQAAGIVLAALGGVALGVQAGTNSTLGKYVGKGTAGIISFASGLVCIAVFFVVSTYGAKAQGPSASGFQGIRIATGQACSCALEGKLLFTCRDTLVGLCRRWARRLLCHHCDYFRSAARKRNRFRRSSHSSTDYSCYS